MVYERGESVPVGVWGAFATSSFALGVATDCNLSDNKNGCVYSRADPGFPSAAAELERSVAVGVFFSRRGAAGDWNGPEGEIRWAIATPQGTRSRGHHEHVIGDPNWVVFYRDRDPL